MSPPKSARKSEPIDSFWHPSTLEALAAAQRVHAVTDANELLGGWPGEVDDGFEEEIHRMRRSVMTGPIADGE